MQKTVDAAYYQCERTGAFIKGRSAVIDILESHYGKECQATPHNLSQFISIPGYKFKRNGEDCFIPVSRTPPQCPGPFGYAGVLESKDLIVPPYLMPAHTTLITNAIKAEQSRGDGSLTVDFCLSVIYTPEAMGRYFESLFSKIDSFKPYMRHIDECIRSYLLGHISVSVSGLLLAAEGILRSIGSKIDKKFDGITSKDQFTNLISAIEESVLSKTYSGVCVPNFMRKKEYMLNFDEQIFIIDSFKKYFTKRLYEKTSEVQGLIDMNRHSVLHALSMDFDKPINFYRLFIMLVFLAFISVLLGHDRASAFVPETEVSKLKSNCYEQLALIGVSLKNNLPM